MLSLFFFLSSQVDLLYIQQYFLQTKISNLNYVRLISFHLSGNLVWCQFDVVVCSADTSISTLQLIIIIIYSIIKELFKQ